MTNKKVLHYGKEACQTKSYIMVKEHAKRGTCSSALSQILDNIVLWHYSVAMYVDWHIT